MTDCVTSLLELIRMMQSELNNLSNETSKKIVGIEKVLEEPASPAHNIYSFCENTNDLLVKDVRTYEKKIHTFKEFKFTDGCQYAILPSGDLIFTGGYPAKVEVVQISPSYNLTCKASMATGRRRHGLTLFRDKIYALSGWGAGAKCESYDLCKDFWEEIPDIPKPTGCITPIGLEATGSVYVLGGYAGFFLKDVQVFDVLHNTWTVLDLKLPMQGWYMPCFSVGHSEVLFIGKKQLWSLKPPSTITLVKELDEDIQCCGGPCILEGDTLHCSYNLRHSLHIKLGHLGWASKRNVLWVLDNKLRVTLYRDVLKYL